MPNDYIDGLRKKYVGITPLAAIEAQAPHPTYRGFDNIGSDLMPSDVAPDTGLFADIGSSYLRAGADTAGQSGIPGVKSPQGLISSLSASSGWYARQEHITGNAERLSRMIPGYDPALSTTATNLVDIKAGDYYDKGLMPAEKDILSKYGFDRNQFLRNANGEDAKAMHREALSQVHIQQQQEEIAKESGWTQYLTAGAANFGMSVLTDPTNLVMLGVPGAAKAGLRTAAKSLLSNVIRTRTPEVVLEKLAANRLIRIAGTTLANTTQTALQNAQWAEFESRVKKTSDSVLAENETYSLGGAMVFSAGLSSLFNLMPKRTGRAPFPVGRTTGDTTIGVPHPLVPTPPDIAIQSSLVLSMAADLIGPKMKYLTNNPGYMQHLWASPLVWADLAHVGIHPKDFLEFLDNNPTRDLIEKWFADAESAHATNLEHRLNGYTWDVGDLPPLLENHRPAASTVAQESAKALAEQHIPVAKRVESSGALFEDLAAERSLASVDPEAAQPNAVDPATYGVDSSSSTLQMPKPAPVPPAKTPAGVLFERKVGKSGKVRSIVMTFADRMDHAFYLLASETGSNRGAMFHFLRDATGYDDKTLMKMATMMKQHADDWAEAYIHSAKYDPKITEAPVPYGHNRTILREIVNANQMGLKLPTKLVSSLKDVPRVWGDQSTHYTKLLDTLHEYSTARDAYLKNGGKDNTALILLDSNVQKTIKKIEEIRAKLGGAGVSEEIGESARGQTLSPDDTATLLNQIKPEFFDNDYQARMGGGWLTRKVIAPIGLSFLSTGLKETLFSHVPGIRAMANLVADTVMLDDTSGRGKNNKVLSIWANRLSADAQGANAAKEIRGIIKTHNLSPEDMQTVFEHAHRLAGAAEHGPLSDSRLNLAAQSMASVFNKAKRQYENRGLLSGALTYLHDNYVPTPFRSNAKHLAGEIRDALHGEWVKDFAGTPSGDIHEMRLHVKTLQGLGIVAKEGQELDPGSPYAGKVIANLDDLTDADKLRYLESIRDRSLGTDGIPTAPLYRDAWSTIDARMGGRMANLDHPTSVKGTKYDAAKNRKIHADVWFRPELYKYIENDFEKITQGYFRNNVYEILKKESVNAWAQKHLGTSRTDLDLNTLFDQLQVRIKAAHPADGRILDTAFTRMKEKMDMMDGRLVRPDIGSEGALDWAVVNAINVARIAVSAKNSTQQVMYEWPMILLNTAFTSPRDLWDTIKPIFSSMSASERQHDLAGLTYLAHDWYSVQTRMIYDLDNHNMVNRSSRDKLLTNPAARTADAWRSRPGAIAGAGGVITSLTDWAARLSGAATGEDFTLQLTRRMVVNRERARFARQFDKIENLSKALASMSPQERIKNFEGNARKFGMPDTVYARRLDDAGLLDPKIIEAFRAMDGDSGAILKGKAMGYEEMSRAASLIGDFDKNMQASRAIQMFNTLVEKTTDSLSPRPNPWALHTSPNQVGTWGRLHNAFLSYSRAWFNQTMLDTISNEKAHVGLGMAGMAVLSEIMWSISSKMLYRGYDFADIEAEWNDKPGTQIVDVLSRTNFAGSAQGLAFGLADSLFSITGQQRSTSPYPVVAGQQSMIVMAKAIHAAMSGDVELNYQDAVKMNRMVPIMNSPYMGLAARAIGWKSASEWIHSSDK